MPENRTVALTVCFGTGHWPPSTFQNSSSWSAKAFIAPATAYVIT